MTPLVLTLRQESERSLALVKFNVQAGVDVIKRIPTVVEAIKDRGLTVHGAVYDIASGVVEELDCPEDEHAEKSRNETYSLI